MKSTTRVIIIGALSMGLCGCQSAKTRVGEGAVLGALIGAGAGSIIGHQSGETGAGAAVGAATGILAGSLIGSQIEKKPAAVQPAQPAAQQSFNPQQMSLQQIAELARAGVHEDVIIDRMRLTNSTFSLAQSDVDYLQQQGVSAKVIAYMQAPR